MFLHMAQDLEQWKETHYKNREDFIFPRTICFPYSKDDRPKGTVSFSMGSYIHHVIAMVVKVKELTEHINSLTIVLWDIQRQKNAPS